MEISDANLVSNRDWDPCYLRELFSEDFFEFKEHWDKSISDAALNSEMEKLDKYSPIVEDITLEDEVLYNAVERIEDE